MGLLNRIFGSDEAQAPPTTQTTTRLGAGQAPASEDETAVARYRYMLRTAPPETLEQAHVEAFAKLTPEQRRLALQQLAQADPDAQNASDDPQTLARLATRAEIRQPGFLERTFGGMGAGGGMMGGGGIGMGGLIAGGLLTSVAGSFIGGAIAHSFFDNPMHASGFAQSGLMPDGGDTIINNNNYYGDGDDGTATAGDTTGYDATDTAGFTGNDTDTGGFFDTTDAAVTDSFDVDTGGDMGFFGGDF